MTDRGRSTSKSPSRKKTAARKPPPRWRKYLVQAELELPEPSGPPQRSFSLADGTEVFVPDPPPLPWWQERPVVIALAAGCAALIVLAGWSVWQAARDRDLAAAAEARATTLTLRAYNQERTLRIAPNPRSWSDRPDATLAWPEPPQLLELRFPVGYASFLTYAVTIDKVDHGRVMVVERMAPDSNRDLRLALNSSAFGPGEYRIRLQGYTWRGERVDAGWVRLRVDAPR
jgi:hypothetical protein